MLLRGVSSTKPELTGASDVKINNTQGAHCQKEQRMATDEQREAHSVLFDKVYNEITKTLQM